MTADWLGQFDTPQWAQQVMATWPQAPPLSRSELTTLVQAQLVRLNAQQQARVLEAAALTAYHPQTDVPIVPNLLTDDAPQFRFITHDHSLCWVHEGRHYKKLLPMLCPVWLTSFGKQHAPAFHPLP